jgi:N-methylhydantoinase B/oxoprolinase/acetone carboxylase alpha subunit
VAAPPGAAGGLPGSPGRNTLVRAGGASTDVGGKARMQLESGDRLVIETPGGGGWGRADVVQRR